MIVYVLTNEEHPTYEIRDAPSAYGSVMCDIPEQTVMDYCDAVHKFRTMRDILYKYVTEARIMQKVNTSTS